VFQATKNNELKGCMKYAVKRG